VNREPPHAIAVYAKSTVRCLQRYAGLANAASHKKIFPFKIKYLQKHIFYKGINKVLILLVFLLKINLIFIL